ncbi:glycosyl transferase family 2 [Lentzea atacamensis]|uniref:Glycosyl transferase family 2 n=1 Tax=Lentzea atacamensis TaxID=531938 RepID=A0ABX9E4T9_9PSEU|nr:glycosyltransferase family A protein [Lentzea atacamensis]RAS64071.1 glycosyl transferase family 2 [Lentzea atacamensis]
MPVISVLTPAHPGRAEYVREAGESLARQELPEGWELEWVVQEDAVTAELDLAAFPFTRHELNGERLGIAITRNLALTRASGELVHVLDSDDRLLPGALAVAIKAFQDFPDIHWVATQADDLLPDRSRKAFDPLISPGHLEAGAVNDYVLAHIDDRGMGRWPFHHGCMTMRADTVRALGGWAAIPRSEDGLLLAALCEVTPGYFTPEVTWLVRQHDTRSSRSGDWHRLLPQSMAMIRRRIEAIRTGPGTRAVAGAVPTADG